MRTTGIPPGSLGSEYRYHGTGMRYPRDSGDPRNVRISTSRRSRNPKYLSFLFVLYLMTGIDIPKSPEFRIPFPHVLEARYPILKILRSRDPLESKDPAFTLWPDARDVSNGALGATARKGERCVSPVLKIRIPPLGIPIPEISFREGGLLFPNRQESGTSYCSRDQIYSNDN